MTRQKYRAEYDIKEIAKTTPVGLRGHHSIEHTSSHDMGVPKDMHPPRYDYCDDIHINLYYIPCLVVGGG